MAWSFRNPFVRTEKREVTYGPISKYVPSHLHDFNATPNQIKITEKTALSLSAVWASVKIPSESLASVPRGVYYKDNKGNSILAVNSNAQRVLMKPNPFMNAYTWQLCMGYSYRLRGNAYSQIVRDENNTPTELIPIHPDRVQVKLKDGKIVYEIDLGAVLIKSADMLHFKGLTSDGYVGLSPIQMEAQNLGIAISTQLAQKNFYEKGSNLDFVLTNDSALKLETVQGTKTSIKNQVTGTTGDRFTILDAGFKITQLKLTAQDLQLLEAIKGSIPNIARIFSMPLHLLNEMDASSNNNIERQGIDYVTYTVMPFAAAFEAEMEDKLLASYEKGNHFIKYNLNGLMRGDYKSRVEGYRVLHSMGVPLNNLLALEDMNQVEGGNISLVPLNMISANKLDEYHFTDKAKPQPKDAKRNGHTIDEIIESIQ